MTTLREAAQQALEALEAMQSYAAAERKGLRICDEAIPALRAALEQQAEPVEPVGAAGLFTLAHLWAQQCYFKGLGRPCDIDSARGAFEQALKAYTAPPQRKPLTEGEIMHIGMTHQSLRQVARAVERAHGIKE